MEGQCICVCDVCVYAHMLALTTHCHKHNILPRKSTAFQTEKDFLKHSCLPPWFGFRGKRCWREKKKKSGRSHILRSVNFIRQFAFYTMGQLLPMEDWDITATVTLQLTVSLVAEEILKNYVLWFFTDLVREAWQGGAASRFRNALWPRVISGASF